MAVTKQVLVWGATPDDKQPLFKLATGRGGPEAGLFRRSVRERLQQRLKDRDVEVLFSEDGERYGHHVNNPGLYEPLQIRDAKFIVLILPGNRAMAVNTWELALACETDRSSHIPNQDGKLAFVIPRSVWDYLDVLIGTEVDDPAEFQWPTENGSEPELGPQNSFAARWIYLYAPDRFGAPLRRLVARGRFPASGTSGNPGTVIPIYPYDDSRDWNLGTPEGDQCLAEICNWVYTHLPD